MDERPDRDVHERELLRRIFHARKNLIGGSNDKELDRILETARRKFVELLLRRHADADRAERELWEALYQYELHRTEIAGQTYRCTAARQKINRLGMVAAAIEIVLEARLPQGQRALVGHDHPDHNFEMVVINNAAYFGTYLVAFARQSLALRRASEALARAAASPPEAPRPPLD